MSILDEYFPKCEDNIYFHKNIYNMLKKMSNDNNLTQYGSLTTQFQNSLQQSFQTFASSNPNGNLTDWISNGNLKSIVTDLMNKQSSVNEKFQCFRLVDTVLWSDMNVNYRTNFSEVIDQVQVDYDSYLSSGNTQFFDTALSSFLNQLSTPTQ